MKSKYIKTTIALAALAMLLVGCSNDSLPPSDEPVVVTAIDYGFEGLPERVRAGTTLALENDSPAEIHELVAIRLPDGEDRSIDDIVQLPPEEFAALLPGLATVVIAPPGESGFAVEGTGVLDKPGRYAVICAIPTGADPQEYLAAAAEAEGEPPQFAGGPPHLAMGMYGEITVVE